MNVTDSYGFTYKQLPNGRLDDTNTKSEYERGYIDCWNENFSKR